MSVRVLVGDVRDMLRTLPERSVHCCVTSPPYWGLRAYGTQPQIWGGRDDCQHVWGQEQIRKGMSGGIGTGIVTQHQDDRVHFDTHHAFCRHCNAWRGELGSEPTPELFCRNMIEVFNNVRRVLRDDGTLWLNIGDSYASSGMGGNPAESDFRKQATNAGSLIGGRKAPAGLNPKDLVGIPWMLAFALRADGWYLRSEVVWHKLNPMPESVTDRPTRAHEQIFLLSKSPRYFFDQDAVREPAIQEWREDTWWRQPRGAENGRANHSGNEQAPDIRVVTASGRNIRSVWQIASEPFNEAHFATFPKSIPERCIKAGTSERGCCATCGAHWERTREKVAEKKYEYVEIGIPGEGANRGRRTGSMGLSQYQANGWQPSCTCNAACVPCTVLDCFNGSGTSGVVAKALGRNYIGIELNPDYAEMAKRRIAKGYESTPKREALSGQRTLGFEDA